MLVPHAMAVPVCFSMTVISMAMSMPMTMAMTVAEGGAISGWAGSLAATMAVAVTMAVTVAVTVAMAVSSLDDRSGKDHENNFVSAPTHGSSWNRVKHSRQKALVQSKHSLFGNDCCDR